MEMGFFGTSATLFADISLLLQAVILAGFLGPDDIKDFVYLPTVIVHGLASLMAFALAGYTVYYGYTRTVQKKKRVFSDPSKRIKHRLIGILAISTWALSFSTGLLLFVLFFFLFPKSPFRHFL